LALTETAAGSDLLDSSGDINAGIFLLCRRRGDDQLRRKNLWFFLFQGSVATPAE
jgi:hypothetical protein